jgi:hypothetical protein
MDTESDVSVIVMRVTRRLGWPLFKMLDDDHYSAGSNFAKFIMKKVSRILILLKRNFGGPL